MKRGISTVEVVMSLGIMALMLAATVGAISLSPDTSTPADLQAEYNSEVKTLQDCIGQFNAARAMRSTSLMRKAERAHQDQIDKITKLRKKCESLGVVLR